MRINKNKNPKNKMVVSYFSRFGNKTCRIVKGLFLLLAASALLLGCAAQQPVEPTYTDMYESHQYLIQTVTNEIVTTVFVARYVETNKVFRIAEPITDFGGYNFDSVGQDKIPAANELEFQCVGESCEIKRE